MHRGSNFNRGGPTPPVNVGDELDVTIEAVGAKGDGIAKKNGFVLFVPNVKEGETVRIRVTKVLQKVGFAEKIGEAQSTPAQDRTPQPAMDFSNEPKEETEDFGEPEESEDFGEEPADEDSEEPKEELDSSEEPDEPKDAESFGDEPDEPESEEPEDEKKDVQ